MPHGQPNPEIRSMLFENVACRVKIMCVNETYCPGENRLQKWVDLGIDSHIDKYLEMHVEREMEAYDEDEISENDKTEIEENARLGFIGHYYEEAAGLDYFIEHEAAKNIIEEMSKEGIHKDNDFEPVDFEKYCD